MIATDASGMVTFLNPVAQELIGWSGEDALGQQLEAVFPIEDQTTGERLESPWLKVLRSGGGVASMDETTLLSKDGKRISIGGNAAPIRGRDGDLVGVVLVFRDSSLGKKLAVGVTHDLNNLLMGIIANASLMMDDAPPGSPSLKWGEDILSATEQAARLARQMLAYSGRGHFPVEPLSPAAQAELTHRAKI